MRGKKARIAWILSVSLLWMVAGVEASRAQARPPADLDSFVARSMKTFDVPGIAVAIVKDGKVVMAKGYGVRKLGEASPVNERTLFAIGSVSKSFTAAALGMLVDEGKMKWDDPVIKHLPNFLLKDPFVTRELTIRDGWAYFRTDADELTVHVPSGGGFGDPRERDPRAIELDLKHGLVTPAGA